jgi:hypothetical protein
MNTAGMLQSAQWPPQGYVQVPLGWQCPICQAIYAPHIGRCESCTSFAGAEKKPEMTEEH